MNVKVTRLYTGTDGKSHFADVEIPLDRVDGRLLISETTHPTGMKFVELESIHQPRWHPAPRRQFVIWMKCKIEIEVGDGSKRQFGPGDILLAEDTTGEGHIGRVISGEQVYVILTLD